MKIWIVSRGSLRDSLALRGGGVVGRSLSVLRVMHLLMSSLKGGSNGNWIEGGTFVKNDSNCPLLHASEASYLVL